MILFFFFFNYSYVHTRLGSFLSSTYPGFKQIQFRYSHRLALMLPYDFLLCTDILDTTLRSSNFLPSISLLLFHCSYNHTSCMKLGRDVTPTITLITIIRLFQMSKELCLLTPRLLSQTEWLKTTEMYSATGLEARGLKLPCRQGHAPSDTCREETFLAFSQLLVGS
jgi:hypothetical protein